MSQDWLRAGVEGCRGQGKDSVSDDGPNTLSGFVAVAESFGVTDSYSTALRGSV